MKKVEVTVSFDEGSVIIGEESYTEWKEGWKKLKKILTEGQKRNRQQSLAEKEPINHLILSEVVFAFTRNTLLLSSY